MSYEVVARGCVCLVAAGLAVSRDVNVRKIHYINLAVL
jgi:hypothetical protein